MAGPHDLEVSFRTVFRGNSNGTTGFSPQPGLFLIRTEEAWTSRWESMNYGRDPVPECPPVSWESELVVALILGWRPTTGFRITVERVALRDR